jgi:hypothetical protein
VGTPGAWAALPKAHSQTRTPRGETWMRINALNYNKNKNKNICTSNNNIFNINALNYNKNNNIYNTNNSIFNINTFNYNKNDNIYGINNNNNF